jgi:hypothetical protein
MDMQTWGGRRIWVGFPTAARYSSCLPIFAAISSQWHGNPDGEEHERQLEEKWNADFEQSTAMLIV